MPCACRSRREGPRVGLRPVPPHADGDLERGAAAARTSVAVNAHAANAIVPEMVSGNGHYRARCHWLSNPARDRLALTATEPILANAPSEGLSHPT